jgi:hypothetical protein
MGGIGMCGFAGKPREPRMARLFLFPLYSFSFLFPPSGPCGAAEKRKRKEKE